MNQTLLNLDEIDTDRRAPSSAEAQRKMIRCDRYCLYKSLRVVNLIVNLFGVVMIVYTLWLLKKWMDGVAELPTLHDLPRPWFIYVCLGVGIIVCLSTLSGHMVANCINNSILAVYIVAIFSVIVIQAGVIIMILFKIDWETQIIKYISGHYKKFKSFILFHLVMCRLIAILVLVAQTTIVLLATILWVVGAEPTVQSHLSTPLVVTQSFLADYNSPALEGRRRLEEIIKSYTQGFSTRSFRYIRRNQS